MGQWGVRSYEGDEAADALDAGFQQVHGEIYETMMDDGNPLTYEQVQAKLANPATLAAALAALELEFGTDRESWPEEAKLGFAGVLVRHVELEVPVAPEGLELAISWLEAEEIDWEEATARRLRKSKELDLLTKAGTNTPQD